MDFSQHSCSFPTYGDWQTCIWSKNPLLQGVNLSILLLCLQGVSLLSLSPWWIFERKVWTMVWIRSVVKVHWTLTYRDCLYAIKLLEVLASSPFSYLQKLTSPNTLSDYNSHRAPFFCERSVIFWKLVNKVSLNHILSSLWVKKVKKIWFCSLSRLFWLLE